MRFIISVDQGAKIKIVLIAHHYWPRPGAATVRLLALVKELRLRGAAVTVITLAPLGTPPRQDGPNGELIVSVSAEVVTGVHPGRVFQLIRFAASAYSHVHSIKADVVIADPPPSSGLVGVLARSPFRVYYLADSWSGMLADQRGYLGRALSRIVKPLETASLRRSNLVIAVRENLASLAVEARAKGVVVAPYGTDLTHFRPVGPGWQDPWSGRLPYFVYAGNYGPIQGAGVFLDAAALLWRRGERFGVVFMGYGSDAPLVAAASLAYPEFMKSYASVPMESIAEVYRSARAALASMRPVSVASGTRPAKALAAIACGCPVLFAGEGSFSTEVADYELGRACRWDAGEVAVAIEGALAAEVSQADKDRLALYAAKNYDLAAGARVLVDLIESGVRSSIQDTQTVTSSADETESISVGGG